MILRKSMLPASLFAMALAALLSGPVAAQATGTIRGVVLNRTTGEGMAEVLVSMDNSGRETRTGVNGAFEFLRVVPGQYELRVSALGFSTVKQAVTVTAGEEVRVEIGLEESPIQLDELLATADRSFSAASSRTVRAFDLFVRPVRSAQDLLRLAPGLVTAQHAGGGKAEQIFLRGFETMGRTSLSRWTDFR